jgi:hypothetical protein
VHSYSDQEMNYVTSQTSSPPWVHIFAVYLLTWTRGRSGKIAALMDRAELAALDAGLSLPTGDREQCRGGNEKSIGLPVPRQLFAEGSSDLHRLVRVQCLNPAAGARAHGALPVGFEVGVMRQVRIRNDPDGRKAGSG